MLRFSEPRAITPWESAIALEGMRARVGLSLYESGHATHLYGPLLSVALGGVFALSGLNLLAARVVFAGFSFALVALLTWLLNRGRGFSYAVLAALLFLSVNLRTSFVFFSTQPDCLAALLAIAALAIWAARKTSLLQSVISLALFLLALFCKQTSAAFALVPIAHALFFERARPWSARMQALIPAAFLLLSLLSLRLLHPAMFQAIVATPAALKIHYTRAPSMILYLLGTFPIFLIALTIRFFDDAEFSEAEKWIGAAILVLVPISVWTTIKSGGGYNSLLFGYLAMTAFVVLQLPRLMRSGEHIWRTTFVASLISVAILCSFFFGFEKAIPLLFSRSGDKAYPIAVELARRLGSGVVTPEDPTIAFRANNYYGRALYLELDAHAVNGEWPPNLPEGMQRELDRSRYLIAVQTYVPSPLSPALLTRNGFREISVPTLRGTAYTLWARGE